MIVRWLSRLSGPALAALAGGALYAGWTEIDRLRGTPFWEFRYVLLGVAAFLLLGLVEKLHGRLRGPPDDP